MKVSTNPTVAIMVLVSLIAIIGGVWLVFGIGWAAIVGGVFGILLAFGAAYDAVASAEDKPQK